MSLGDEIREEFKADGRTILKENIDRAKGLFQYHIDEANDDWSINISDAVRDTSTKVRILVYLIAKRLMFEAGDSESETLRNDYFYEKFDVAESSIRAYIMELRNDGLVRSEDGEHRIVVENLPRAFDLIEDKTES